MPLLLGLLMKMPKEIRDQIIFELQSLQVIGYIFVYTESNPSTSLSRKILGRFSWLATSYLGEEHMARAIKCCALGGTWESSALSWLGILGRVAEIGAHCP
jgi:hypothetical protein